MLQLTGDSVFHFLNSSITQFAVAEWVANQGSTVAL